MSRHQKISIIIPTLNETENIRRCLKHLELLREAIPLEIIVADSGSNDGTALIAKRKGATVVNVSPPQRATQMNAGARIASGDILIFLHADSRFDPGALEALIQISSDQSIIGGGFRRRFRTNSVILRIACYFGNLRASKLGWYYGDQAIWVRSVTFNQLGGYPIQQQMEDLDFSRKMARHGRTKMVRPGITTSARRFQSGVLRRLCLDVLLVAKHVITGAA
jgi:rSAM/selenodomain-associated transferase 2